MSDPLRRAARLLRHEWSVAGAVGVALAVVMTWPTAAHLSTTIPQDIYDPLLQAWQVAWGGHALLHRPTDLWDTNAFHPEPDSLAFSDSLLGYAPAGLLGDGPVAALVRYNVLFVLAHALAFVGMYALCRQLGARWPGAAMAGAAFAYAPWRLPHAGHLNVLSTGGIALALAMLARGHGLRLRGPSRPDPGRWGWVLGGWLVAAWQVSLGFGLGLPFSYVLGAGMAVALVLAAPRLPRPLLLADLGGAVAFGAVALWMALPYLRVLDAHPYARRTVADLDLFSPPWQGFLVAPEQSWLWGGTAAETRRALPFPPEMVVFVGWALVATAVVGLFVSAWGRRARLLIAAGAVLSVVLAMGTRFPGGGRYTYLLLFDYLPGWDGSRTPGRLVVWTTLLLGVLAAGAVTALAERLAGLPGRPGLPGGLGGLGPAVRIAALALPAVLVLAEGRGTTPHPVVPTEPAALRGADAPVLVLPTDQLSDQVYMYWSTDGFPALANGGSGIIPLAQTRMREAVGTFPDAASVAYLKGLGVRTVVVFAFGPSGVAYQGPGGADPPVDGLGVTRQRIGDALVYRLE